MLWQLIILAGALLSGVSFFPLGATSLNILYPQRVVDCSGGSSSTRLISFRTDVDRNIDFADGDVVAVLCAV